MEFRHGSARTGWVGTGRPVTARAAAVLPVRFGATRLPGKPLLDRTGWPLIRHVWEQVRQARRLEPVIVATDDERIARAVAAFGGRVEMTDPAHPSGSDRVAEVTRRLGLGLVLNVQGDEPEIDPGDLDRLVERLAGGTEDLVTLARPLRADESGALADPHTVKVVLDARGRALYFSRSPIPHGAGPGAPQEGLPGLALPGGARPAGRAGSATGPGAGPASGAIVAPLGAYAHQGVYAWRREALLAFAAAPPVALERMERLEQLRALALGMTIGVVVTEHESLGIDTPADYARFVERHARRAAARPGNGPGPDPEPGPTRTGPAPVGG